METLAWASLEPHLRGQIPVVLRMGGTRNVRIGFNPISSTMFLRLPIEASSSIPPSPYAELAVESRNDEEGIVLEIATATEVLFREFHRFSGILTEDFEQPGQTAVGAFETAIRRWGELAARKQLLTGEQRLGLQGELAFLRPLLRSRGARSILAWTGRTASFPGRHDFRLDAVDIEVKSTRASQRRHIIHGLAQLQENAGRPLYILSLKFENSGLGPGRSLQDEVEGIRRLLADANVERQEFELRLATAGYIDAEAPYYDEKLRPADQPVLIKVDDSCPRITNDMIARIVSPAIAGHIAEVSYRIDVEGFGVAQGSEEYSKILGEIQVLP